MSYGYHGKILHIDLTAGQLEVEEPDDTFYRKYMGGSAMGVYYLLKHTPPGADPLGPENTLSLMTGVVTGAPISGQSRVTATAKSPVTGLAGDSQAGGFWPAELKAAGFDGIVIHGRAAQPLYLWVHDGEAELRDAGHLWGQFTADVEDAIREELGDRRVQVLQCGPAGEKGVRFGALINNANRANGRTGMGTVMASKNLKAVAVRGRQRPELADPEALKALAKWGVDHFEESDIYGLGLLGTAEVVRSQNAGGGLPTRNWSSGTFEGVDAISGQRMADTILKERETCFGCVVRCKRVVEVTEGPFRVDPRYGGPEYETIATMGSYCGVSDLAAVSLANQLCNMVGMDTISCGATIAWAMDCFERGLITLEDTGGVELRFGNAEALVQMVEQIGEREGFGRVLGEGSARAAETLGVGAGGGGQEPRVPGAHAPGQAQPGPDLCRQPLWRRSPIPRARSFLRAGERLGGLPGSPGRAGPARPAARRQPGGGEGALRALHPVSLQLHGHGERVPVRVGAGVAVVRPRSVGGNGAGSDRVEREPVGAAQGG